MSENLILDPFFESKSYERVVQTYRIVRMINSRCLAETEITIFTVKYNVNLSVCVFAKITVTA